MQQILQKCFYHKWHGVFLAIESNKQPCLLKIYNLLRKPHDIFIRYVTRNDFNENIFEYTMHYLKKIPITIISLKITDKCRKDQKTHLCSLLLRNKDRKTITWHDSRKYMNFSVLTS